jgi:hypothetical protein
MVQLVMGISRCRSLLLNRNSSSVLKLVDDFVEHSRRQHRQIIESSKHAGKKKRLGGLYIPTLRRTHLHLGSSPERTVAGTEVMSDVSRA